MRGAAVLTNLPAPRGNCVPWLASLALGCLALAGCATSTIQPVVAVPDDPEFRARLDGLVRAFEAMDANAVIRFYAQDTYSVAFDFPYALDPSSEDHLKTLERFFATLDAVRLEPIGNLEVRIADTKAWTSRSDRASGVLKGGDTFQLDGWHSAIWENRAGEWVIVYEHVGGPEVQVASVASPPAPAADPRPAPAAELRFVDVFFEYDKWEIRPDGALNLRFNVDLLKANPALEVTIEGYCDERGTPEYNRQLGQRRADAVKAFLVSHGIAANRVQTVSLGESRTFSDGQGERAWSFNRRAHFVIRKS